MVIVTAFVLGVVYTCAGAFVWAWLEECCRYRITEWIGESCWRTYATVAVWPVVLTAAIFILEPEWIDDECGC